MPIDQHAAEFLFFLNATLQWRSSVVRWSARPQGRESDDVADRWAVCQQHDQPVDADTETAAGRQPVFERGHVVLVEELRFFVTRRARLHLRLETLALVLRIIELREGVRDLPTVNIGLKPLDETRVAAIGLRQG